MATPERMGSTDLSRRVRELEAIALVASNFTFEQPIEAMMAIVAEQVVAASESARGCVVALGDRDTQLLERVLGSHGAPEGFAVALEYAWHTAGSPIVSGPLGTRTPVLLELAVLPKVAGYEMVRDLQALAGWTHMAVVPMVIRGVAVGLVLVFYAGGGELPEPAELSFLVAIADQAAVAVENARLFERAQAAAVMEERQRLSRELHDSVSQALYGIALGAQTAQELLGTNPQRAAEPIAYVLSLAEICMAEMRALIFELRPEALTTEGLVAAIQRQLTALQARHQFATAVDFADEPELPLPVREMLYRVAQQALQNSAKHAQAGMVSVTMTVDPEARLLVLAVRDDGAGFDPEGHFPGHLGLISMRERAAQHGARVTIESAPGQGTTVSVHLPLANR